MKEFEDAFEYSETEDQAEAIIDCEARHGVAASHGRLLCGDVGYCKTEVAQCARLLGDQRQQAGCGSGRRRRCLPFSTGKTFKQRLPPFPVKVEMISRFARPRQIKKILERVATGKVRPPGSVRTACSRRREVRDLAVLVGG